MLIAHQVQHLSQLDRQTQVLSMSEMLTSVHFGKHCWKNSFLV